MNGTATRRIASVSVVTGLTAAAISVAAAGGSVASVASNPRPVHHLVRVAERHLPGAVRTTPCAPGKVHALTVICDGNY
ncbi:MAG: hypothetical protein ACTHK4_05250 [Mycobacteriales bacterium]